MRSIVAIGAAILALASRANAAPLAVPLAAAPVGAHGITRDAIAVAAPASFRTTLDAVPTGARLLTAIAVPEATPGGAPAAFRFRIEIEVDGTTVPLYERVLDGADARDRRWVDVGVALDALAGRSGAVRFDVAPVGGPATTAAGWWAPPELVVCDGTAPSLLLVTIDALRADRLGSAGYLRGTTPHLDAFATDATRFAAAFAGGPKTIPSVPQILTGRFFYWHRPTRGLTEMLGNGDLPSRAIVNNPYVASWLRAEQPGFASVQAGELDARAITSAALRYLTAARGCPTALYLHYLDTHTPYRAPARWARRFIDRSAATTIGLTFEDVTRAWQHQYGDADRQRIADLYDGNVAFTDRQIGRLLRGVARRGRLDRTLVIVTADHGEELWDHREFFHGQSLYDELLHVPLLVRWPTLGHGRVVTEMVRTVDLAPTVAEALHHPVAASDGRSLTPLATGSADTARTAFALVSHAEPRTPERQAARTATSKVIRDVSDGAIAIYDLTADPREKRNLGLAAPGAAELIQLLDGFRGGLDGKGYQLRLRGHADRPARYAVDVATEPPLPVIAIDRLTLEPGDLLDFKSRSSAFGMLGALTAGDEDHVRFDVLAKTGVLKVTIRIDGVPAGDGTLRLGSAGTRAGAVVDLADRALDGAPASPDAADAASDVVVELWRSTALDTTAIPPALDDAGRERLRQLGYVE